MKESKLLVRCDPKQVVTAVPDTSGVDDTLAREAEHLLGYSLARSASQGRLTRKQEKNTEMITMLEALDLRPFDPRSVAKYQQKQILNATGGSEVMFRVAQLGAIVGALGVAASAICLVGAVIATIAGAGPAALLWLIGCLGLIGFAGLLFWGDAKERKAQRQADWREVSINRYEFAIPEYALQTAIDIKKQYSNANLVVHYLHISQIPRPYPDPFLVLRFEGTQEYEMYLEVWDEPDFKAKRLEVRDAIK